MPAKDRHHDAVVRALIRDGWAVVSQQLAIVVTKRHLWIDIQAVKGAQGRAILVEVKGFENMPSPVDYLAGAIGKYVLYRAVLDYASIATPLYMAVPIAAYEGILSEDIGQQVIWAVGIRLVVFDPDKEDIVQWIP